MIEIKKLKQLRRGDLHIMDGYVATDRYHVSKTVTADEFCFTLKRQNLCRILHTVICSVVGSKKMAASWVQENYGERWRNLVGSALEWQYGIELDARQEAIDFLDFAISEVSKTAVYTQVVNDASYIGEDENGSC